MAYPMAPSPTFGELRQRLVAEFSCSYETLQNVELVFNDGTPETIHCLSRTVNGTTRTYAVTYGDDERLLPSEVWSICQHLGIDPSLFGLSLDHYLQNGVSPS